MTTQKREAKTACVPASTHCPNCGKAIPTKRFNDFGDPAVCGQRQLLNRLFEAHDEDRQSLASELHEDLTQRMTGALLRLQTLERLLQGVPDDPRRELRKAQQLLSHSIGAARRIANRLQPPALAQFGLAAGIDCLTTRIARDGEPAIEFSCDADFARVCTDCGNHGLPCRSGNYWTTSCVTANPGRYGWNWLEPMVTFI